MQAWIAKEWEARYVRSPCVLILTTPIITFEKFNVKSRYPGIELTTPFKTVEGSENTPQQDNGKSRAFLIAIHL